MATQKQVNHGNLRRDLVDKATYDVDIGGGVGIAHYLNEACVVVKGKATIWLQAQVDTFPLPKLRQGQTKQIGGQHR
jgi:hypothetical protein